MSKVKVDIIVSSNMDVTDKIFFVLCIYLHFTFEQIFWLDLKEKISTQSQVFVSLTKLNLL